MSILTQELQNLLPLRESKNSARRHVRIFKAIDILYHLYTLDKHLSLSAVEQDLARGFIAALVFEFITDRNIFEYIHNQFQTSLVECGERIDLHEVKVCLTEEHRGFGPSLRKVGESEALRPLLEEILGAALEKSPRKFLEKKDVDKLSSKVQPKKAPQSGIWGCATKYISQFGVRLVITMDENLLSGRGRANFYRLFLYVQPSFKVWMNAYEQHKISVKAPLSDSWKIFSDAACGLDIDERNREAFNEAILSFGIDDYYKILGKLAQRDSQIVDDLLMMLPNTSPPVGLRITNALIVAAHRNETAVRAYLDVKENREKFPHGAEEYALIRDILDPVNKEALKSLLEEASRSFIKNSGLMDQPRPRAAMNILKRSLDLDPEAQGYLLHNLRSHDTSPRQKTIALLLISNNRQLLRGVTESDIVETLISLIYDPIALLEEPHGLDVSSKSLTELAILTSINFALCTDSEIQIILLEKVVNAVIEASDDFYQRLNKAVETAKGVKEPEKRIDKMIEVLFEHNKEHARTQLENWLSTLPPDTGLHHLYNLIIDSINRSLATCLESLKFEIEHSIINKASSRIHPIIRKTYSHLFGKEKIVFDEVSSPLFTFTKEFWKVKWILSEFAKQIRNLDDLDVGVDETEGGSELGGMTIPSKLLEFTETTAKQIIEQLLSDQGSPIIETHEGDVFSISDLLVDPPRAATIGTIEVLLENFHLHEMPLGKRIQISTIIPVFGNEVITYRLYAFASRAIIRSPFIVDNHLVRILDVASSKRLGERLRANVVSGISLLDNLNLIEIALKHLERFLSDKSALVTAASVFSITKLIEKGMEIIDPERKSHLIESIESECFRINKRNLQRLYTSRQDGFQTSSVNEIAHSALYRLL